MATKQLYACLSSLMIWGAMAAQLSDRGSKNWGGLPDAVVNRAVNLNSEPRAFDPETTPWVEQVGTHPKVYYFHNFLTDAERQHMLREAAPYMKRSTVVGDKGASVVDNIRTSYGTFLMRRHDPVIERIENRISMFTHLPFSHQEDIQVLRYGIGQTYGAHYDSSYDKMDYGPKFRFATFLMYLSDVEEGGETAFPHKSEWVDPAMKDAASAVMSDCAKGHVAAKPKKNDAVLFYSYHPNGTHDEASMHTGCPVIKGIKWAAPVWIHVDEFRPEELRGKPRMRGKQTDPGACEDISQRCKDWSASGECEKNKGFMMGDAQNVGACRKSCKQCEQCAANDWTCINRNRDRSGYLKLDKKEMDWLGVEWWNNPERSPEL